MSKTIEIAGAQLREWAGLARECSPGWGRAFISDVYKTVRLIGAVDCTLAEFKTAIVETADCRSVLRRLVLASAFDRQIQEESETSYLCATYHLVCRPWCTMLKPPFTRERYLALFSSLTSAIEFEEDLLSTPSEFLPPCVVKVKKGRKPTVAYWKWLIEMAVQYGDAS